MTTGTESTEVTVTKEKYTLTGLVDELKIFASQEGYHQTADITHQVFEGLTISIPAEQALLQSDGNYIRFAEEFTVERFVPLVILPNFIAIEFTGPAGNSCVYVSGNEISMHQITDEVAYGLNTLLSKYHARIKISVPKGTDLRISMGGELSSDRLKSDVFILRDMKFVKHDDIYYVIGFGISQRKVQYIIWLRRVELEHNHRNHRHVEDFPTANHDDSE